MKYKIPFALSVLVLILSSCNTSKRSYKMSIKDFRNESVQEHLEDDRSPIKEKDVDNLDYFSIDETYAFICDCQLNEKVDTIVIPTYSGNKKNFQKYAQLSCANASYSFNLTLFQNMRLAKNPMYKEYLFLPFMDTTNGETTYGGGRYIDVKISDIENEKLFVDFNKAYNPWCAYSDGYNCPIPPLENHLEIAILAGEKSYKGIKKKKK